MAQPARTMALMLLFGLVLFLMIGPSIRGPRPDELPFSTFVNDMRAGRVARVEVAGTAVRAEYHNGDKVNSTALNRDALYSALAQYPDVEVAYTKVRGRPWWTGMLAGLLPAGILLGYLWLMTRGSGAGGGGVMKFRDHRARRVSPKDNTVTMSDVAGMPEVKEELAEIIDYLREPERYRQLGARTPKGVLLEGPPGVGKTLLARAIAGEAGVSFYSASGSDFVELFAGVGASRVRDLFQEAQKNTPAVIFIDEIDAVGRHRGVGIGGANDEREQTLNQILVAMDGFTPHDDLIVIAATNRIDVLDPALLRPGRFDRHVHIDPPDKQGRLEILQVHARGKRLEEDVDLQAIAGLTVGFTGADLANLLNEAALLTARRRKTAIGMDEIEAAYERIVTGGAEKKRVMRPGEKERVAFHEAGHAVASRMVEHSDPIQKVSIIPRGQAGGYVLFRKEEDRWLQCRSEMLDALVGILAGRAAEELVLGDVSTGAANDLERATAMARQMVTRWGMDPLVGPISVGEGGPQMPLFGTPVERGHSERTARTVDTQIRTLVHEGYQRALNLLRQHRRALERVARALLERETISGSELDRLLQGT